MFNSKSLFLVTMALVLFIRTPLTLAQPPNYVDILTPVGWTVVFVGISMTLGMIFVVFWFIVPRRKRSK